MPQFIEECPTHYYIIIKQLITFLSAYVSDLLLWPEANMDSDILLKMAAIFFLSNLYVKQGIC